MVDEADPLTDLMTEHDLAPSAIEDVLDIEQLPKSEEGADHLFVVLHSLRQTGDRIDTIEVEHRVDALSDAALDAQPHVLGEVQLLRREEATIRTVLTPQLRLLGQLVKSSTPRLNEAARRQLIDAYDVHGQVVASLAMSRQLLSDTLDTYRGAVAEGQARAANLLTVYAAIVLPMSLIAGWYGMNTADLPAASRPWGWIVVTAVMVAVGVVSWLSFARMGLVGRPRPLAPIGRGLAAAARAPLKPVTMLWRYNQDRADT